MATPFNRLIIDTQVHPDSFTGIRTYKIRFHLPREKDRNGSRPQWLHFCILHGLLGNIDDIIQRFNFLSHIIILIRKFQVDHQSIAFGKFTHSIFNSIFPPFNDPGQNPGSAIRLRPIGHVLQKTLYKLIH